MSLVRSLVEKAIPWFNPDAQHRRLAATATLATKAERAVARRLEIQTRAAEVVESYQQAQEHLWRH
jgi:hypothetical protein